MREPEMSKIAEWIAAVGEAIEEFRLPEGREERATALRAFRRSIEENRALEALRGDEERTGGIIHSAMFARLLLAEFVVADLTLANANVFYELGIRHAAKPFTTVPIFANASALPFDVALVRAVGYQLKKGKLTKAAAQKLKSKLAKRCAMRSAGPR